MSKAKLASICPVFISTDIEKTVDFYVEKLGFKYAKHYDKKEKFATVYRDEVEFVIIQAIKGQVESNSNKYGVGDDAYIVPEKAEQIDALYEEFKGKGIEIPTKPHMTDYGSYEFKIKDIDGRLIGIGRICDKDYFKNSNFLQE
jgi:catechol 2,3-dioxygenase-like lactoylglutathione lyase family enzyme